MKLFMQMLSFFSGFVLCAAEPCFTNVAIRQSNPYPWGGSVVVGYEAKNDFAGWAYTNGYLLTTHLRSINPDAEAARPDTGNAVSPIQSDPVPVRDVPIVAEAAAPTLRECAATAAPATSRRRRASWASASAFLSGMRDEGRPCEK